MAQMASWSRIDYSVTAADLAELRSIGLGPKKRARGDGAVRPLGIGVERPKQHAEAWRANIFLTSSTTSWVPLSDPSKWSSHPFRAVKEMYEYATSKLVLGPSQKLTSPALQQGRDDANVRQAAAAALDKLIAKAETATTHTAGPAVSPPSAAAPTMPVVPAITSAAAVAANSAASMKEQLKCSLCMDTFDNPYSLPCQHAFCYECVKQALNHVSKCPNCKFPARWRDAKKNHLLASIVAASKI